MTKMEVSLFVPAGEPMPAEQHHKQGTTRLANAVWVYQSANLEVSVCFNIAHHAAHH